MKQYLISEKEYLATFSKEDQTRYQEYLAVMNLKKARYPRSEIANQTKSSLLRITSWTKSNPQIPFSIRCIQKAQRRNYFVIEKNTKETEMLAYLVGFCMGDGNIHRRLCNTWFYGVSTDLPVLNALLQNFSVQGTIHTYRIDNGKMCVSDNAFTRFMVAIGCPMGDKTKSHYCVPKWIWETQKNSEIKKKFLQGMFDSELEAPALIKGKRFSFQSPKFYHIKTDESIEHGRKFLEEIRKLMHEFGISTGEVKKDRTYIRSRDNSKMIQLYFAIHSNYINLDMFLSKIGFLHNTKRVKISETYAEKIKMLAKEKIKKEDLYQEVTMLRKEGLSAYKIAKRLNVSVDLVKGWTYGKHMPMKRNYLVINS